MRYPSFGSWFAFAAALALFAFSDSLASAAEVDIEIKGKVKDDKSGKDKPTEVAEGEKILVKYDTKIKGDCGTCTVTGTIILFPASGQPQSASIPARPPDRAEVTIDLSGYALVKNAKAGDVIVVYLTITCVKGNQVVCTDTDSVTINIVKPKK